MTYVSSKRAEKKLKKWFPYFPQNRKTIVFLGFLIQILYLHDLQTILSIVSFKQSENGFDDFRCFQ